MVRGFLFDMDGVLLDTEKLYIKTGEREAAAMGYPMKEGLSRNLCGTTGAEYRRCMLEAMGPDFDFEEYLRRLDVALVDVFAGGAPRMPHVEEVLARLKEDGFRLAVASSTKIKVVRRMLGEAGLLQYFEKLIGGDMVPASKPAPDIYLRAARELGIPPGECAAVEDSRNGVRSAVAAGCVTIMIPDTLPPDEELHSISAAVLDSLPDLIPFIRGYNERAANCI